MNEEEIRQSITELNVLGVLAYGYARLAEVAATLRRSEDGGLSYFREGIESQEENSRLVAAALAEQLLNPEMIPELEAAAIGDESMMVRRLASHAAMAIPGDHTDALIRIFEAEEHDNGVRLNAWAGLAQRDPATANARFGTLLEGADATVSADRMTQSAVMIGSPDIGPSLMLALDNANVRRPVKIICSAGAPICARFAADD